MVRVVSHRLSGRLSDDELVRLVDRIYAGAVEPGVWPEIVQAAAAFVGAPIGRLFTPYVGPDRGGLHIASGMPDWAAREWSTRFGEHDLWNRSAAAGRLFRAGRVLLDGDLVPARDFARSLIYRSHLRKFGIGRLCTGVVSDDQSETVPPTQFAAYRDLSARPFCDLERNRLRLLLPHLARALRVLYRLRDAERKIAASLAALDRLHHGVILLADDGTVAYMNREAERIIRQGGALTLRGKPGAVSVRLAALDTAAHADLQRAMSSVRQSDLPATTRSTANVILPRGPRQRPLVLELAPLPEASGFATDAGPASAIAFVVDPAPSTRLDTHALQRLYGVTRAEARLAERLFAGEALALAAAGCGISEATARTQLRRLLEKTGTRRQADLMRVLVSLGVPATP